MNNLYGLGLASGLVAIFANAFNNGPVLVEEAYCEVPYGEPQKAHIIDAKTDKVIYSMGKNANTKPSGNTYGIAYAPDQSEILGYFNVYSDGHGNPTGCLVDLNNGPSIEYAAIIPIKRGLK